MAAAGVNQGAYPVIRVCVFYFWDLRDLRYLSVPRTFVRNRKDGQKEGDTGTLSIPDSNWSEFCA